MRFSVFRGGFTREAAAQVAGAGLPTLARLISKSLLAFDPSTERYRVHEVLRQYGQEKLAQAGTLATIERRHFDYFLRAGGDGHATTCLAPNRSPGWTGWMRRGTTFAHCAGMGCCPA